MIKLKYKELQMITGATMLTRKLVSTPLINVHAAYQMKKILDAMNRQAKIVRDEAVEKLINTFAVKDADGKLTNTSGMQGDFDIIPGKEKEFQDMQESFDNKEFTIDRNKIKLGDLAPIQFSISELSVLDPVVDMSELESGEAPVQTPKLVNISG